jgi:hypothetical protein
VDAQRYKRSRGQQFSQFFGSHNGILTDTTEQSKAPNTRAGSTHIPKKDQPQPHRHKQHQRQEDNHSEQK